jgi:hypothetical protein
LILCEPEAIEEMQKGNQKMREVMMTAMSAIEAMGTWAKQQKKEQKFQHLFREVVEAPYSVANEAKYV